MSTTAWAPRCGLIAEPDSLRYRFPKHSSYSLPIVWEPELLDQIDCDVLPPSADDSSSGATLTIEDPRIADEVDMLSGAPVGKSKDEASRRLFRLLIPTDLSLDISSRSPRLLLDGRPVASTPSPLLFRSKATSRPIFAFIDNTWLSDQRYKFFGRSQSVKTTYNTVQSMVKLQFQPYVAGIMISMAQESLSATDDEIQVHVFSPSTDHKSLVQYSSSVSRQYLRKWKHSYVSSECRLIITQKVMPFKQPNAIMETLRKTKESHNHSLSARMSAQKGKAMSDITKIANQLDIQSATKYSRS